MEIIIVSIGALSKNALWNERVPVRASHATTTLIRTKDADGKEMNLLVDPSLPAQALDARIFERAGIKSDAITHVFLTNWRPVHRRALEAFARATWWMHGEEIRTSAEALAAVVERAGRQGQGVDEMVAKEQSLLARVVEAPDQLAEGVDLYPLSGYTPGQCGLILAEPTRTTVLAGDAVPTAGHFMAGQVFADCWDLEKAKGSLAELYEIADVIIPGHDNVFWTPRSGSV